MAYLDPSWLGAVAQTLKSALQHFREVPMGKLSGVVWQDMSDISFME
jgi:hypothetical protein